MSYYSKEDISKAKEIDLLTYLKNYEPQELVVSNKNTYTTKTHDSLKISNGMWYWFSKGIGGKTALEYLIQVRGYTFIEAVENLLGYSSKSTPVIYKQEEKKEIKKLILPEKSVSNEKVIKYLTSRGIDKDIIQECIENEFIYQQSPNNNVVFVGYDSENIPRYAGVRATNSTRYMKDVTGSSKEFSFKLEAKETTDTIHIFESAIDVLSYATLLKTYKKNWHEKTFLSLAGVYQPAKDITQSKIPIALSIYLKNNPNIEKIVLNLDNDNAGRTATKALINLLSKQYKVIDNPPPKGKDYNDFLCIILNKIYEKER